MGSRWVALGVVFLTRVSMGLQFQAVAAVGPPLVADLTEQSGDAYVRTIIKTADPERYGIVEFDEDDKPVAQQTDDPKGSASPSGSDAGGLSGADLASISRTLAFNDPQAGFGTGEGEPADRNVELLVNGQVVRNDVSFPFDLSAIALGSDPEAATVTVRPAPEPLLVRPTVDAAQSMKNRPAPLYSRTAP